MEDDGIWTLGAFYGLCYILWTFGIVRGNLICFFPFWKILYKEKSGNPGRIGGRDFLRSDTF
jgi:hypothetical protein